MATERAFAPSARRKNRSCNHTKEVMTEIAVLIILSIIAIVITLNILWRVLLVALKLAFVFVLAYLFVKAVLETIWGLMLIVSGSTLYVMGSAIGAMSWVSERCGRAWRRIAVAF